jgi:hypothetical protein
MLDRSEYRRNKRKLDKLSSNAKQDMADWATKLEGKVTQEEMYAWKDGYLAGFERGSRVE